MSQRGGLGWFLHTGGQEELCNGTEGNEWGIGGSCAVNTEWGALGSGWDGGRTEGSGIDSMIVQLVSGTDYN